MSTRDASRRRAGEAWDYADIFLTLGGDIMGTIGAGMDTGTKNPEPGAASGGQATVEGGTASSPQKGTQQNSPSIWTTLGGIARSAGSAMGKVGHRVTGGSAYTGSSTYRPENDPNQPGGNRAFRIAGFSPLWILAIPAAYLGYRGAKAVL